MTLPFRSDGSETAVPHAQEWKPDGRRPTRRKMQSTIPIVASTKMTPQEPKKAKRSIALSKQSHLEAIRVDWQRNRLIVDSRLQIQSRLDHKTCSKSKSGSSELLQNSLEDHSSMKLSILVGELTSWPSFSHRKTTSNY